MFEDFFNKVKSLVEEATPVVETPAETPVEPEAPVEETPVEPETPSEPTVEGA